MNQNWKTFGMNSARQSEAEMSNREHCKSLLSGAVFEYLDEEKYEEFIFDLSEILVKESEKLLKRASVFTSCAKLVEKGIQAMIEEEAAGESQ